MIDVLSTYKKLSRLPLGKSIASRAVTLKAPYFSTIRPLITDMEPGFCAIELKDRRAVHNHLGTIHAIAMCNLCELTMGMALHPCMPHDLRWIAKGMSVRYLKKARGTLKSSSRVDLSAIAPGDMDIPVVVKDASEETVMDAVITVYISKRQQ
jgi:acyl-coenzyme A thioesterase PaaI-like protein